MENEKFIDSVLGDLNLFNGDLNESAENFNTILSCSMKYVLDNLILNNITDKISYEEFISNSTSKNYLLMLNKKIEFLISKSDSEETKNEIKSAYTEVLYSVIEKLEEVFNFQFEESTGYEKSSLDYDDLVQHTVALYDFLIINRFKNIIEYLFRVIFYDRKNYSANLKKKVIDKKNFTFISLKKILKIDDVIVIYFLREIIREIINDGVKFKDFMDQIEIENNGEISNTIARRLIYEDNEGVVSSLFKSIEDPDIFSCIVTNVRNKLIEVLPKKSKSEEE